MQMLPCNEVDNVLQLYSYHMDKTVTGLNFTLQLVTANTICIAKVSSLTWCLQKNFTCQWPCYPS